MCKMNLILGLLMISGFTKCGGPPGADTDMNQVAGQDVLRISVVRTAIGPSYIKDLVDNKSTNNAWYNLNKYIPSSLGPREGWAKSGYCPSDYITNNVLFKDCIGIEGYNSVFGCNGVIGPSIIEHAMDTHDDFRNLVSDGYQYNLNRIWDYDVIIEFWAAIDNSEVLKNCGLCPKMVGNHAVCDDPHPQQVVRHIVMLYVKGNPNPNDWLGLSLYNRNHYVHLINADAINWYVEEGGFGSEYWVVRLHPTYGTGHDWKKWLCEHVELHEFAHTHLKLFDSNHCTEGECAFVHLADATQNRKASAEKLCYTHYSRLRDQLRFIENTEAHGCP